MQHHDYTTLITSLDRALEILARNRSPDPIVVAAYDSLKQTKAIVLRALQDAPKTEAHCYAAAMD